MTLAPEDAPVSRVRVPSGQHGRRAILAGSVGSARRAQTRERAGRATRVPREIARLEDTVVGGPGLPGRELSGRVVRVHRGRALRRVAENPELRVLGVAVPRREGRGARALSVHVPGVNVLRADVPASVRRARAASARVAARRVPAEPAGRGLEPRVAASVRPGVVPTKGDRWSEWPATPDCRH